MPLFEISGSNLVSFRRVKVGSPSGFAGVVCVGDDRSRLLRIDGTSTDLWVLGGATEAI